ncbi:hypothetical protein [Microscilla marina]|uniref:Uncharacterized protein n=1 Tax=Microscilla marina ATCC 23134 TaxID=313606 RepID=A1ZVL4_MICM2|nr:hypothetical protein [Microscilla marina]EAY25557.1 hypothetical protein M23134_00655 [Microscilla marina ATCC 23134]
MLHVDKNFFLSKQQAEEYLNGKILAVITEYTIFKLDLLRDQVMFRCLLNQHTFSVFFEALQNEINASDEDLQQFFLDALITYCAINIEGEEKRAYPIGEFNNNDELLDWFLVWKSCSKEERIDFIEST